MNISIKILALTATLISSFCYAMQPDTTLFDAVRTGAKSKDVETLLDDPSQKKLLNATDPRYVLTPLQLAVRFNHKKLVELLAGHEDIKIDATGAYKDTALHTAARGGKTESAKILIRNNASVEVKNDQGELPLHYAASDGFLDLVKLLVEKKPSTLNVKDDSGRTALSHAASKNHPDVVKYLIDQGALAAIQDDELETAFYEPIRWDKPKVIEALLKAKDAPAALMLKNKAEQTAREVAAKEERKEIERLLETHEFHK